MPLTDTACRNAKPRATDYTLSDGGGLHLLVKKNGSRLWRLSYRYGGKQKVMALGPYPDVSLADARELRSSAKRQLSFGIDPAVAKKEAEREKEVDASDTFEAVAREWFSIWKIIGRGGVRQRLSGGPVASPLAALDQAVAIKHRCIVEIAGQ